MLAVFHFAFNIESLHGFLVIFFEVSLCIFMFAPPPFSPLVDPVASIYARVARLAPGQHT
jgi:hypothetical protein